VAFVVTVLVIIRNIFIFVFERPPAVKIVPEIVEGFNLLLAAVLIS
jgi:hypothetical protein